LEQLARAIFQSWFVDFDPVRAKVSGEPTDSICRRLGLTPELLALFPEALEKSVIGEFPVGWKVKPFTDFIEIIGGGTPKTSITEYWNGNIPWFSVVDAPSETDIFAVDTEKKISQAGLDNSSTRLLPQHTTIISARGTVGRLALISRPMTMNQSCYGIVGRGFGPFFTYFATRELVNVLKKSSHGTVFDTITRDTFYSVRLPMPSSVVAVAFENTIRPLLQRVQQNCEESRTLGALRDELLPKLLSGDLRTTEHYDEAVTGRV
jgi:type I restriction enzyme S subunit